MKRVYDEALKATVTLDDAGRVRGINNLDEYRTIDETYRRAPSIAYLRDIAGRLDIPPELLRSIGQPVSYTDPQDTDVAYRLSAEKTVFDTTTYAYYQTFLNTPVWGAGITVTVKHDPERVIAATDTSARGIDAKRPTTKHLDRYRQLFAAGEKIDGPAPKPKAKRPKASDTAGSEQLTSILGKAIQASKGKDDEAPVPQLIRGRFFVYRYNAEKRTADYPDPNSDEQTKGATDHFNQPCCGLPPTLPLPPAPKSIHDGHWYLVAELIFRLPYRGHRMNWRMLVDVKTDAILYLRALSSGVNGLVFTYDPITKTGITTNTPDQSNAVLNPHRDTVVLENLDAPVGGTQSLQGTWATLAEIETPTVTAPTRPVGSDFDYDARTNDFAAVNAYYHTDRFFQLVADLGFPLTGIGAYFGGTAFPVEVDHRGLGNVVNAHCIGDGDGIDHTCYSLADTADTTNPMGIAADWRVVLHEIAGHGILYDHVNSANFGFAHSAGDSFAMILNDYASEWHNGAALDRFLFLPFVPSIVRRSDRSVAAGWGWGGANDVGSYSSEQILSTTMFRAYRSIGGDATRFTRREFAARCMAYLMLRAVGTLTPLSNPSSPAQFLNALLNADAGNWTSEGLFGGAYGKVLIWSFEKQNLNDGARPNVDVYIDDGRAGEYPYLPVYWETVAIWNRHMADGLEGHQEPTVGTNYAYVKIKNRGTSIANNVVVKAYHCKPLAGLVWPDDLQPMATPELSAGTLQPDDTEEKTIGPFAWTPVTNAVGHDSMVMIVSAPGDPSNVDNFTAGEQIEDWRLVPNDNNVALRNVRLEPRLVTVIADSGNFGDVCVGSFKDMRLSLSNSGYNTLSITAITTSSAEFLVPSVLSYPITIGAGDAIEVPIRLEPTSAGPKAGTITMHSDDPNGPKSVAVSGSARTPRLVTLIANAGHFGNVCIGSFVDEMLILSNSGHCPLTITGITSSSAEFVVANILSYPLTVGAGDSVQVPMRFEPVSLGAKSATITIQSNDPDGDRKISVSGKVPSGKLAVTGSTCIGGVKACCLGERTIAICNVGDCRLNVTSVAFKRKSKYWKLINNPFPATLHAGACLSVLIRYKAEEKCPRCCELVITSDDPVTPVLTLDVMAYTVWSDCGCKQHGDDCCKGCCDKCHCDRCSAQSMDPCCYDENHQHEDGDEY